MVRARGALDRAKQSPAPDGAVAESILRRFLNAVSNGNEKELLEVLAADAILIGDGGGKVPSILNPLYGSDRIARFFLGLQRKHGRVIEGQPAMVNGGPGLLLLQDGKLSTVVGISIEGDRIAAIYAVSNPDKLRRI